MLFSSSGFQIELCLREKEKVFNKLFDLAAEFEEREGEEVTELQREEVDKLRDFFRQRAKNSWNVVMSQEMTLLTQTEQVRLVACSSSLDDSSPSARHVFVWASSSGLRGRRRTYLTIL
jgi:hypothetical protein